MARFGNAAIEQGTAVIGEAAWQGFFDHAGWRHDGACHYSAGDEYHNRKGEVGMAFFSWLLGKDKEGLAQAREEVRQSRGEIAASLITLDRHRTRLEQVMIQMIEERAKDASR